MSSLKSLLFSILFILDVLIAETIAREYQSSWRLSVLLYSVADYCYQIWEFVGKCIAIIIGHPVAWAFKYSRRAVQQLAVSLTDIVKPLIEILVSPMGVLMGYWNQVSEIVGYYTKTVTSIWDNAETYYWLILIGTLIVGYLLYWLSSIVVHKYLGKKIGSDVTQSNSVPTAESNRSSSNQNRRN